MLAQRKNIGIVSGDVLVGELDDVRPQVLALMPGMTDGRPLASDFARGTAYGKVWYGAARRYSYIPPAEQMDVHEGTATVREAMRFSANLRQPFSVPQEEKDDYVDEVIELLELQDLADALVMTLGAEGTHFA